MRYRTKHLLAAKRIKLGAAVRGLHNRSEEITNDHNKATDRRCGLVVENLVDLLKNLRRKFGVNLDGLQVLEELIGTGRARFTIRNVFAYGGLRYVPQYHRARVWISCNPCLR